MPPKIAFVRPRPYPPANEVMAQMMKKSYPDCEVEVIEVYDRIKRRKDVVLINLFHVFKEYGPDILAGKKSLKHAFWRTRYIFKAIKMMMAELLSHGGYRFSFQMQSLFDASAEGVPHFLYTDHTHLENLYYPDYDRAKLFARPWVELEKTIYQNTAINFTRSANISRSLVEQYDCPDHKIVCVRAGSNVDTGNLHKDCDSYARKNILFVGIDWNRKGGPDLVEAFKLVLQAHPDARLTIVGCKPEIDLPNCDIVGRLPLGEIGKYYQRASVFCLPTTLEPFGIVFIEALSHKLPVVATNIGAIPDFVLEGENGYLVAPRDVKRLAEKLIELLREPEKCRAFGARGYQLVMEKYTWDNVVGTMKQHIGQVLDHAHTANRPYKES